MTQGTAYLVTNNKIYYHNEFNGDMYPDGYGDEFLDFLSQCMPENFDEKMKEFNKNNHNYSDFETYSMMLTSWYPITVKEKTIIINFNKKYYEWFFSDYIFFKNASNKNIEFILSDHKRPHKTFILKPNETCRFYFGDIDETFKVVC